MKPRNLVIAAAVLAVLAYCLLFEQYPPVDQFDHDACVT